jgi:hypothetical protein
MLERSCHRILKNTIRALHKRENPIDHIHTPQIKRKLSGTIPAGPLQRTPPAWRSARQGDRRNLEVPEFYSGKEYGPERHWFNERNGIPI